MPAEFGGAQGDPPCRLPSDRRARRDGRRGRCLRDLAARSEADGKRPRHRGQHGRRHHRYLAEGAWTKRLHAGWAAQSGLQAAVLARAGFNGPRTVFEGSHGFFHGFAHSAEGNYGALVGDFGERWVLEPLAFKPYPCGTMAHPFIDCARRLAARGISADDIGELVCETAEEIVHRLWEPLADKQRPMNGYAAKFSIPYCVAAGFIRDGVGLDAFTDESVRDPQVVALASRVRYEIDPAILIQMNSPVIFVLSCVTGPRSRNASRTSAAARTNRSRGATSRRNSHSMRSMEAGVRSKAKLPSWPRAVSSTDPLTLALGASEWRHD